MSWHKNAVSYEAPKIMNCNKVVQQVYQYLDGEGYTWRRKRIEKHLNGCGDCHEMVAFEEKVLTLVKDACSEPEAPPELFGQLQALIEKERRGELN